MINWNDLNNNEIFLETSAGRFIITRSCDPDYPGIYVDYQEPGKPIRNLALTEHMLEDDILRTVIWSHSDGNLDYTDAVIYDRPELKCLEEVSQAIKTINQTHSGLELEAKLYEDERLELGYWDLQVNFNPLKELFVNDFNLNDLDYCVTSQGWKFTRE